VKAVFIALAVAVALAVPAASAAPTYPNSIASLGDSITRAFDTCSTAYTDCPANSWSTGTNTAVNSWYTRFTKLHPTVTLADNNDAKTGAKMADVNGQAATAVGQNADVVTILMGSNDVCTSSVATMTPVTTLGPQLDAALKTLTTNNSTRQIYVGSIPNVYHLWEIFHNNFFANIVWGVAGICQSLLANPRSTSAADNARRLAVQSQTKADNDTIASVCSHYTQCHFDNYAAYSTVFTTSNVTTRDYFHPSVSGQALAAQNEWVAFFGA
jgi:lysophospholipase L1-like esterase